MSDDTQNLVPAYRKDGKLSLRAAVAYVYNKGRPADKLTVSVYMVAAIPVWYYRPTATSAVIHESTLVFRQTIPASTSEDDQRKLQEALLVAVASRYDAEFHLTRKITVRKPIRSSHHGLQRPQP